MERLLGLAMQGGKVGAAGCSMASHASARRAAKPLEHAHGCDARIRHPGDCPSGRLSATRAHPSDTNPAPAPLPTPGTARSREPLHHSPGAAPPSSQRRGAARHRAKRLRTPAEVDDLAWLGESFSAVAGAGAAAAEPAPHPPPFDSRSSSRAPALIGRPTPPNRLPAPSGSGPPSGPPLSPATARALAQGFRLGDLALASAGPLQVWCRGGRRAPADRPAPPPCPPLEGQTPRAPSGSENRHPPPPPLRRGRGPNGAILEASRPHGDGGGGGAADGHGGPAPDAAAAANGAVRVGSGGGGGKGGGGANKEGGDAGAGASLGCDAGGCAAAGDVDVDVDVLLLGPPGRPRDLSVLAAAVERLVHRPAGRCCVGCVVLTPSRERAEALQEAAFALLERRGGGPEAMHVRCAHGGTGWREDVSGLRFQPPDLLIATPGRLRELLTSDQVRLGHLFESLRVLVLDGGEALASRGLRPQVERLLRLLPNTATYLPPRRDPASTRPPAGPRPPPGPRFTATAAAPAAAPPRLCPRAVTLVAAAADAGAGAVAVAVAVAAPGGGGGGRGGFAAAAASTSPPTGIVTVPGQRHFLAVAAAEAAEAAAGGGGGGIPTRPDADPNLQAAQQRTHGRAPAAAPAGGRAMRGFGAEGSGGGGGAPAGSPAASELRSLIDMALRRDFAIFRLGIGNGSVSGDTGTVMTMYGGSREGGDQSYGTLAAAVAAALGEEASPPSPPECGLLTAGGDGRGLGLGDLSRGVVIAVEDQITHGSMATMAAARADARVSVAGAADAEVVAASAAAASAGSETWGSHSPPPPPPPRIATPGVTTSTAPPLPPPPPESSLLPLHVLAAPYEEHLSYLYVVLRQHMLTEGRHKVVVHFPSGALAALYAALFRALGFPAALAGGRTGAAARGEAVADFLAAHRGLLFTTADMAGLDPGCGLSLVLWVGLPRRPGQLVQHMAAVQQAAAAAAVPAAFGPPAEPDTLGDPKGPHLPAPTPIPAAAALAPPPRCLLLLHDVESPRPAAAALAEALAAGGLGRLVPMQTGAWSGPLEAASRRVEAALSRVPPAAKLRGLEGLMGFLWASRTATATAALSNGRDGGGGVGGVWPASCVGLGPRPEQQLGVWARRFAAAMGMSQPPLLARAASARMGLRSVPGVVLVDFHAGRPPPLPPPPPRPRPTKAQPRGLKIRLRLKALGEAKRLRQQEEAVERELRGREEERLRQREERLRRHEELLERHRQAREAREREREGRPRWHPPAVIGRYWLARAQRRAARAEAAEAQLGDPAAEGG